MASKSKPRKVINAFNQFEEKLRKYLDVDNNPDFIAALREMIKGDASRDDIKATAKSYELSDANTERLIEMNAKWHDLNKLMKEIESGKAIDNNLRQVMEKFKELKRLSTTTESVLKFRLSARNLHLLPDIKKDEVGFESKKILNQSLQEIDGYVGALKELQQNRPLCAGIIKVCINNPHMDTAEAKNIIDMFRDLSNKQHPSRLTSKEEFLDKYGKKYHISAAQFNRAWEASQQYLISVAMKALRKSEDQLKEELSGQLKQLEGMNGNITFQDYLKVQQAVKALRLLDGKHIKKLFGENGKEIRRGFEKKFREITKAREKKIESGDINKAQFISAIQHDAIKSREEGNKIYSDVIKATREFSSTLPAVVKKLEKDIDLLSTEMMNKKTEMNEIIERNNGNISEAVRKQLIDLHTEIQNDLSKLESLKERFDTAVQEAKKSIPEAPPPPNASVNTAASNTATAASNASVSSSVGISPEKKLSSAKPKETKYSSMSIDDLREKALSLFEGIQKKEGSLPEINPLIAKIITKMIEELKELDETKENYIKIIAKMEQFNNKIAEYQKQAQSASKPTSTKLNDNEREKAVQRQAKNPHITSATIATTQPRVVAQLSSKPSPAYPTEYNNNIQNANKILNEIEIEAAITGTKSEKDRYNIFNRKLQDNEFQGDINNLKKFVKELEEYKKELYDRNIKVVVIQAIQEKRKHLEEFKNEMKDNFPVAVSESLQQLEYRIKALLDGSVNDPQKEAESILHAWDGLIRETKEIQEKSREINPPPVQAPPPAPTQSTSSNVSKQRDLPLYNDAKNMLKDYGCNPYEILKITSDKLIDKSDKEKDIIIEEAFDKAMKTTDNKELVKAAYAVLRDESARQLQEFSPPFNSTPVSNVSIDHHMQVLEKNHPFDGRNAYQILDLDTNNLSDQEVKKAYEDRQNPLPNGISKEVLDAAYEVLKNSEAREEYNRQIEPTAPRVRT